MQHAGRMLLAAGLDGGHTFIFIPQGMKMQIESVTRTFGVGNIYSVKQAQKTTSSYRDLSFFISCMLLYNPKEVFHLK